MRAAVHPAAALITAGSGGRGRALVPTRSAIPGSATCRSSESPHHHEPGMDTGPPYGLVAPGDARGGRLRVLLAPEWRTPRRGWRDRQPALRRCPRPRQLQVANASHPGHGPDHQVVLLRRALEAHRVDGVLVRVAGGPAELPFRCRRPRDARVGDRGRPAACAGAERDQVRPVFVEQVRGPGPADLRRPGAGAIEEAARSGGGASSPAAGRAGVAGRAGRLGRRRWLASPPASTSPSPSSCRLRDGGRPAAAVLAESLGRTRGRRRPAPRDPVGSRSLRAGGSGKRPTALPAPPGDPDVGSSRSPAANLGSISSSPMR